jgi:tetratricopeptide (TPR) repeat protein
MVGRGADRATLRQSAELAQASLEPYGVLSGQNWVDRPAVANLDPEGRAALRRTVADMLWDWADAERRQAEFDADDKKAERLQLAWRLNLSAETCSADPPSQSLWLQRSQLADLLRRDDADALHAAARSLRPKTANDLFRQGCDLALQHEFKKAIPLFRDATQVDPQHFRAWLWLGNCYVEQLQFDDAADSYSACLGTAPFSGVRYFPHYHRAVVHAQQRRLDAAEQDIDQAIAALPDLPEGLRQSEAPKAYLQRAYVLELRKDYAGADRVLTDALALGQLQTQLYGTRARVRALRKDAAGRAADLAAAVRHEPADEAGWNERGLARFDADPQGALADFEQSLKLNPRFVSALQNKAAALDRLKRPADSLAVLNALIELYPGFVRARMGRAVLLARQGKRDAAHQDVREALARDRSRETFYQAANVYALTSKQHPADADRVAPLLAPALWFGFGLDFIDQDEDMDPVRAQPGFKRTVEVLREFQRELPLAR